MPGVCLRLWRAEGELLRIIHGNDPGWQPRVPSGSGLASTPGGPAYFMPLGGDAGLWIETPAGVTGAPLQALLGVVLRADREMARLSEDLATRYEEIDLLYTISEILGHTVRLEAAALTIVRAVSEVVGARRASIVVYDPASGRLRTVAAQGFEPALAGLIEVDDATSVAARVFREARPLIGGPPPGSAAPVDRRGYRGGAFMSVPICYQPPGGASRCVGVINLTDKVDGDRFSASEQKLVAAIANQIGAAIEIARLVEREREQQRVQDELDLAHHLQVSLLPAPTVLQGDAEAAVRCIPAEAVGGDFYTFTRLGLGLVGVMVGDVSSHGLAAALIMAAVMAAAGIHASSAETPDRTLSALRDSLADKLDSSDTYLTVLYAILDPIVGRLTWASAGHPHAFRIPGAGLPERLEATAPPLGLAGDAEIGKRSVAWEKGSDLLCLWTDGLVDAQNSEGERFGEARLLAALESRRSLPAERIVSEVIAEADGFAPHPADDRTLLVLRL